MGVEGAKCMVTGGSGLTGRRLVEMLAERGAARVVSFDIAPKPIDAMEHPAIEYQQVRLLLAGVAVAKQKIGYVEHGSAHTCADDVGRGGCVHEVLRRQIWNKNTTNAAKYAVI